MALKFEAKSQRRGSYFYWGKRVMTEAVVTKSRWNLGLGPERKRRRTCAWNCCKNSSVRWVAIWIFTAEKGFGLINKNAPGMCPCCIMEGLSTGMSVTLPVRREEAVWLSNFTFWVQRPQKNASTNSIHISINFCFNTSHYILCNYTVGASPFCWCHQTRRYNEGTVSSLLWQTH